MKGILIFLVIFGHSLQGIVGQLQLTSGSIYAGMKICYGFHMAAFFFVAGFFVHNWVQRPFKLAMTQKVKRLVVPYFIWSFVTASAMQLAGSATTNGLGLKDFLLSPIKPFSEYWFLYALFFIFMIYYPIVHKFAEGGQDLLLAIASILYLWYIVGQPSIWILSSISRYFIFFMLGTYMLKIMDNLTEFLQRNWVLPALIAMFIIVNWIDLAILDKMDNAIINREYYLVTAVIGTLLTMCISLYLARGYQVITRYIDYLGKYSMQFYVMHLVFLAGLRIIFIKIFGVEHIWLIAIVITGLSMVLCSISIWCIEKMKLSKIVF